MEAGIGMFGDLGIDPRTGIRKPPQQRLKELMAEIKLADEVGLDVFAIGEHHRSDYAVSSPEIILAAAASITRQIKLTSAVTVLSSSDPVKVFQDFSTVDLLSGGRTEIMVGRGSFIESFPLFGYNLHDYNHLFDEKLELLNAINNLKEGEPINWKGQFRAPLVNQDIFPRPVNQRLPIWIAVGGTPESVRRAARLGMPLMLAIIGGNPEHFKPLIDYYKQEYELSGHDLSGMQIGIQPHAFIADTSEQAVEKLYPYYSRQMDKIGSERNWPPFTKQNFEHSRQKYGALYVGDPEEVADKINYYKEMFGLTRFMAQIDVGGADHSDIMRSIELFGLKVAPLIR